MYLIFKMICYINLTQISPKINMLYMGMAYLFIHLEFSILFLFVSMLTFLVLQPELLLGLLAGEVDAAAELRAIEGLRYIVAAVLLEKS